MNSIRLAIVVLILVHLGACGGGGGCDSQLLFGKITSCNGDSGSDSSEEFTAAASQGELVKYKIDKKAMQYSYTIISSAYGLADISRSGSLQYNIIDDTYTPVGLGAKIAVNSDGLFYGVIKEDFGSGEVAVPVFGVKGIEKSLVKMADNYNYVSYQCIASNPCGSQYGSIRVGLKGDWTYCRGGNLSSLASNCTSSVSGLGFFDESSKKIVLIDQYGNIVGAAIAYVKNLQKVFIIDLNGGSPLLGKGMIVASSQSDAPVSMDGIWRYIRLRETGRIVISGKTLMQYIDGGTNPAPTNFVVNDPWQGFVTTANGTVALAAGSGMYAARTLDGDFSVGLRK